MEQSSVQASMNTAEAEKLARHRHFQLWKPESWRHFSLRKKHPFFVGVKIQMNVRD